MVTCVTRVATTCQWDGILRLIPAGGNSRPMFPHPIPAVPRLRSKICSSPAQPIHGHYLLYVSDLLSVFSGKFDQNILPSRNFA
ncbi:hypothetical protein EI94DRAFT_1747299 [Lactarius quietus]|nr:hypothetical protein EI94DRAFT_1747299 [Lactarius quietus]